jgi:type IV pilus assembly protein PilM
MARGRARVLCTCYSLAKNVCKYSMAFFRSNLRSKKRDQIVVVDLGGRMTKAILLQRKGSLFRLVNYSMIEAPTGDKAPTVEVMAAHLRKVIQPLEPRTKSVILAVGVGDSLLRQVEMPMVPVSDLRQMLKLNAKMYLQQDLPDHFFDCQILPPRTVAGAAESVKVTASPKCKVVVGAAKRQYVLDLQMALKGAGYLADEIIPGSIGPISAFEVAHADVFQKEVVGLVDLGFKNSTISILQAGELALNRVVGIGGDKLTSGLAEAMNISYAEAEGIKVGMPQEVESALQPQVTPLGRELRASIDFFEHQQDQTVSQVYVSGGCARSSFIVQTLQSELMVPCQTWNPAKCFDIALKPQQMAELESAAIQLTVAIGTAVAVL